MPELRYSVTQSLRIYYEKEVSYLKQRQQNLQQNVPKMR